MPATGATHGGGFGATMGGATGSVHGGTVEDAYAPTPPRGLTHSGPAGGTHGDLHGGLHAVRQSADQLLAATDSWGLVVEPVPEPNCTSHKLLYTPSGSEPDADGELLGFSATDEALAASSIQAEFAADPSLFRFAEGRWTLGFNGDRRLSGTFDAPDADTGSQEASITGYGPLQRLKAGGVDVSYSGMAAWEAIHEFASDEIGPRTDNEVRVVVIPPEPVRGQRESIIPADEPLELTGNPLQAFAELCGYAGMVWSVDYSERGRGVLVEVFLPGTQLREAVWEPVQGGVSPTIDTGDYRTDVVIHGAAKSDAADADRYYGEASAPDAEVRAITGGRRKTFETTKDTLESDTACNEFAKSKLDELRGSYQLSGDIDVLPGIIGSLVPGHVYRVPEFDVAAPDPLSPAVLPLRSIEYSYGRGEASRSLSFGQIEDGLLGTLLWREDPPLALRGLSRLNDMGFVEPPPLRNAFAHNYPHAYGDHQ